MADDFAATTATTGVLAAGGFVAGNVEVSGDRDWFRITLAALTTYRIDLQGFASGAGTGQDPFIEGLYDSAGGLIPGFSDDDSGIGLDSRLVITTEAGDAGTYYIAAGMFGAGTGTYRLSLTNLSAADDFAGSAATTGAVAIGGSTTGAIETGGDQDWFAVSLVAGQSYRIDLAGLATGQGSLGDPVLYGIHSSTGALIAGTTNDDGGVGLNSQFDFSPTATGTYYLAAGAYGVTTGTYRISVTSLGTGDDFAADNTTTGVVAPGGSASGTIGQAFDQDWFAVSLVAGHEYRVTLAGDGANPLVDPYLNGIRTAAGILIPGTINDDIATSLNSEVMMTSASTGTYYIAAASFGAGTGSYRAAVTDLGLVDDYAATTATTGTVSVNGVAAGRIEVAGDQDWFGVSLVAGQQYRITVASGDGDGSLVDPFLFGLRDSAGAVIAGTSDDDSGVDLDAEILFTATATGIHYVAAGGVGTGTGNYNVLVTATAGGSDDHGVTTGTAGTVAVGGQASGSIETGSDHDWYAVALTAGTRYRIDVRGSDSAGGTLSDPYLAGLRNADGSLVAGTIDDDAGVGTDSQVSFTAASTGTFYIDAASFGGVTGSYTVAVSLVQAGSDDFAATTATTGSLALGVASDGVVETAGDQDWFAIAMQAGRTYSIDLMGSATASGSLVDPFLRGIHDAAGTLVAGTADDDAGEGSNSRVNFTAAAAGTYYVAAGSFGDGTGSYKLLVRDVTVADDFAATTATTGSVAVGGSSAGVIEAAGDSDWFAVTLVAGTSYRIDLQGAATGNGSLVDPTLRGIHDAAGTLIAGTSDDDSGVDLESQKVFTAASSGTHFIAAGAAGAATGGYKLVVTSLGASPPSDDFAAGTTTTGQVVVGGSATGTIETAADTDWFAVTLVAGQTYRIGLEGAATNGGTLVDPYLRGLYSAAGAAIAGTGRDDGGTGLNSALEFTATTSGVHYIAAGAAANGTGSYKLTVATVVAPPPPPAGTYSIDVRFTGNEAYRSYFTNAAATWQAIITSDLPDVTDATLGFIDDLRIDAAVVAIDGPGQILGQAGPRAFRDDTSLPYLGMMQFDEADLAGMVAKGTLQAVIEHEMGHVLGLGTLWRYLNLAQGFNYVGANAVREYSTLLGRAASSVPLETGGGQGTQGSHWAESVFDRELLTGYAEQDPPMPLSRLTIGALQDLGYVVDYSTADSYTLGNGAGLVASLSGGGVVLSAGPISGPASIQVDDFTGPRVAFFQDKPLDIGATPSAAKLDGTVTSADATTVLFYETTTGNGYLVELVGSFERNSPATAGQVKGTLSIMRLYSPAGLVESYDFSHAPRDVAATLGDYLAAAFAGGVLVESKAPGAQNDSITTGSGDDVLIGALGDDVLKGGAGNDRLLGGGGSNRALFDGVRAASEIRYDMASGEFTVVGPDGIDRVADVQSLVFSDRTTQVMGAQGVQHLHSIALPGSGTSRLMIGDSYTGPVAGLTEEFILPTPENINIATGLANSFIRSGSGDDAIIVTSGRNVVDAYLGSNFITAGSGQDTIFVDARGGGVTWDTIVNFGIGDEVTLWGYTAGLSLGAGLDEWLDSAGTAGFEGLTIHARTGGAGIDASITFAGLGPADKAKLSVFTGSVGDDNYLYFVRIA